MYIYVHFFCCREIQKPLRLAQRRRGKDEGKNQKDEEKSLERKEYIQIARLRKFRESDSRTYFLFRPRKKTMRWRRKTRGAGRAIFFRTRSFYRCKDATGNRKLISFFNGSVHCSLHGSLHPVILRTRSIEIRPPKDEYFARYFIFYSDIKCAK